MGLNYYTSHLLHPIEVKRIMTLKKRKNSATREQGLDAIMRVVSDFTEISIEDMKSKIRKRDVVTARQLFLFFATKYMNKRQRSSNRTSLQYIGARVFRDHATVLNSVKTITNLCETDQEFLSLFNRLEEKVLYALADNNVNYELKEQI